jgi:hypothetical protein
MSRWMIMDDENRMLCVGGWTSIQACALAYPTKESAPVEIVRPGTLGEYILSRSRDGIEFRGIQNATGRICPVEAILVEV